MRWFAVALAALFVASCGTPGPLPTPQFYQLGDPARVSWSGTPLTATLVVSPLETSGLLDGRGVVFSQHPQGLQVGSYPYHSWAQSPARLIRSQLRRMLSDSGAAPLVVTDDSGDTAWRVSGQLERFHRQRVGDRWAAEIALTLRVDAPDDPSPVLSARYANSVTAVSVSMPDTAEAFTRAVDAVFAEFLSDFASAADAR